MTVPTVALDETSPAGSQSISLGDNRIREFKTQVREILANGGMKFDASGQDADMGKQNILKLLEQADLGTGATGKPLLGAQTVSGKAELVFTDEDDNDVQITSGGSIGSTSTTFKASTLDASSNVTISGTVGIGGNIDLAGNIDVDGILETDAITLGGVAVDTAGGLGTYSTLVLSSLKDYGSSASSSTSKNQADLKMCWGTLDVAPEGGSQAVTNLPFTGATTYMIQVAYDSTAITSSEGGAISAVQNSGAQFTIYNGGNQNKDIHWLAIGT